ncbi:MAG: methyltransferase domain-containing protein [Roseibium sp.]|uniref:class I SAM-dependent DNA methyltransferase n=1 Tax=Roseibium sp. TaxID=1936156 RepID=UPI00262F41DE|nr:methyltransferase domain-containing protein [Roseibium sp.]MCV0425837.1 methyltransferase domain-containing protein [Roseibium sp.]
MDDENDLVKQALSLGGEPDAIRKFYKNWSETYEADLDRDLGYVGPQVAAEALIERIADDAMILDAGCGTGLVGVELHKLRPDLIIDGIDLTPAMLAQSRQKGVYRKLSEADLMGPLHDIAHDFYDGVVSAGVFTHGHVGPEGIDELVRVAKSGAPIVLTVRDTAWEHEGFRVKIEQLEKDGTTRIREILPSPYHTKDEVFCQLVVMEAV